MYVWSGRIGKKKENDYNAQDVIWVFEGGGGGNKRAIYWKNEHYLWIRAPYSEQGLFLYSEKGHPMEKKETF